MVFRQPHVGTLGILLGLLGPIVAWVVFGRGAWWFRVMAALLTWPALLCMAWLAMWREATGRHFRLRAREKADGNRRGFADMVRRVLGGVGVAVLSLAMLVPLAGIYYQMAFPPPIPNVALPEPNGYDDLLAASHKLPETVPSQQGGWSIAWYRAIDSDIVAFRSANRTTWDAVLQEVREALERPSRVSLRCQAVEEGRSDYMQKLATLLRVEGEVAVGEGRIDEAFTCFADVFRLGNVAGDGGLTIDWLVESGIKGQGIELFHHLARSLDADQCRAAIGILAAEDKDREPFEQVWQRQRIWNAHALGWTGRLFTAIGQEERHLRPICEESAKHTRAELRIAIVELAVQAYRLDQGRLPDRLGQLVPDYLAAVPTDPLTGKPPGYEAAGPDYVVYSPAIHSDWATPPESEP